jgi:hypothetical protein
VFSESAAAYAGIGDHHIRTTVLFDEIAGRLLHRPSITHIGGISEAGGGKCVLELGKRSRAPRNQAKDRTLFCVFARQRFAYAARCACY